MRFSCFFAAWLLQALVAACADTVAASWSAADLKSKLSQSANVVSPSSSDWTTLVARASYPRINPAYKVVVEVATEADVQATVKYANKYGIPFLAVSGTHGWPKTLNGLKGGIQISLRKLNRSTVDNGGKTATIGGGSLQWEALADLYKEGKQAVTGICECVSVAGPLLGGGHSQLQNQFGFAMDNLVSARVVLANGTVAVASAARNPDLYWALRGAGHNFGIVTSLQVKVYDVGQWTVFAFIFPQEKLEALYTLVNKIDTPKTRPGKLMITGVFARVDAVDPVNPAVIYTVSYEGPKADMQKFADQFIALGPVSTTITENVNYIDLYTVTGNDKDNAVCRKNNNILGAGAALPQWDMQGLRKAYNTFSNYTLDPRFNASAVLLENYGINAAIKIDPKSTALAAEERTRPILVSAIMWYEGDDAKTHDDARKHAKAMKDAFYRGVDASKEKRHAYVNYAYGDEPLPELYGHEQWRLDKLKSLKKAYDPKNAFGFYMPLA